MKRFLDYYIDSFKGLSKEVWLLALITLINRAGTVVMLFMTIYLKNELKFTLEEIGLVLTAYGVGSLVGKFLGGKLTSLIGNYRVIYGSFLLGGIGFILLQYVRGVEYFALALFLLICVADTFRPAMFEALSLYSKPENKTRSVTLVRLAINLGFAVGPAAAGIIAEKSGYASLFWMDGLTCIFAAILVLTLLNPKKTTVIDEVKLDNPLPVYKDTVFWWFFVAMILYSFVFIQLFTLLPLYYRNELHFNEAKIGLLSGMNGLIIFLFEMPLIKWLQSTKKSTYRLMIIGTIITTLGFLALNLTELGGVEFIVIASMVLVSFGEMIALPFGNTFAISRAKLGKQAEYMAWYSMSFAVTHIFSHSLMMYITDHYGFAASLYFVTVVGVICTILMIYTMKRFKV